MEKPFRASIPDGTRLIETFGWWPEEGARRWPLHLARLARSAARLGFALDPAQAKAVVARIGGDQPLRCRLTLDATGRLDLTTAVLGATPARWRVGLADTRLNSGDDWLGVKTTERALYDTARAALPDGLDEQFFQNERGEICEGTITSVFAELADGRRVTPALSCGLLPGILRESLLQDGWSEGIITPADLATARAIFAGNSLRGLIAVDWVN